jgi:hypothetical protein
MKELRLSASQRITGVIWGLIVTGAAVTAMVALSGTEVALVNVIIVALAALGTWLLASALAAARPRKRPDAGAASPSDLTAQGADDHDVATDLTADDADPSSR